MKTIERLGLQALHQLDPETAHGWSLRALNAGLAPRPGPYSSAILKTRIAGIDLPNPVGLAAGFDKNAQAIGPLMQAGFGFLEVGAATPRAQAGNTRPRLFRLSRDRAVINRFGFNNQGMGPITKRLAKRRAGVPVGLNLGANKDSHDRAADFATVLTHAGPYIDFATVNVSSPNTERLRDLQGAEALQALLTGVMAARANLARPVPVFLKIAPDLSAQEITDIAQVARTTGIDAIIATNTTLDRDNLRGPHQAEKGGLSGAPLFEKSTRVLAQLSVATDGQIPLIGVGGIASAEDAYQKIRAGASAVQLYSALVFAGLSLVDEIARGLEACLQRDGFNTIAAATGTGRDAWL